MIMKQQIGDTKWDKLISYMQQLYWVRESKSIVDSKLKEYNLQVATNGEEEEVYYGVNIQPEVREFMLAIWKQSGDHSKYEWAGTLGPIDIIRKNHEGQTIKTPSSWAGKRRFVLPDLPEEKRGIQLPDPPEFRKKGNRRNFPK